MALIIGMNGCTLIDFATAVTFGSNLERYFALAAGRDLSRIRDSRAPSVRFDFLDLKERCSFILNNKIVGNVLTFDNRWKFVTDNREVSHR